MHLDVLSSRSEARAVLSYAGGTSIATVAFTFDSMHNVVEIYSDEYARGVHGKLGRVPNGGALLWAHAAWVSV